MTWPKGYTPPTSDKIPHINETNNVVCKNCNRSNPKGSRYCNKCGVRILTPCANCGNTNNISDAAFCNQCGSKLSNETENSVIKDSLEHKLAYQNNSINNRFREYTLPEHNIKIKYPIEWEKIDKEGLNTFLQNPAPKVDESRILVMFRSPQVNSSDTLIETLAISRHDPSINMTLENYLKLSLHDLHLSSSDFNLIENTKITLAGQPARRVTYESDGKKYLIFCTLLGNTFYTIMFISEITKYQEYIQIVETMIDSFEFTIIPNNQESAHKILQADTNENFLDYISSEHNIKIRYPSSWLKFDNPSDDITVGFQPLTDNASDHHKSVVTISIYDLKVNILNLKEYVDASIEGMRNLYEDFELSECSPITLGGYPAFQLEYTYGGLKHLTVMTVRKNKEFYIFYVSETKKYLRYLSVVEQMIISFEFL